MKVGFISDIHGNYEALKVVLEELDSLSVNQVFCLGDVAGYYSQINECCDELKNRNIPNLMGNHDWYIAGEGFCPRSESVNDCLDYQRSVITEANLEWLRKSSIQKNWNNFKMVHGGWSDPIDEYLRNPGREYFSRIPGKYFLSGHTHIPIVKKIGSKTYCNPGSVGQPRDGNIKASFAVFEDGKFTIHRASYEIDKVCSLMQKIGFSERYYMRLYKGK